MTSAPLPHGAVSDQCWSGGWKHGSRGGPCHIWKFTVTHMASKTTGDDDTYFIGTLWELNAMDWAEGEALDQQRSIHQMRLH